MDTQDYERLGRFYLGKRFDLDSGAVTDEMVHYDSKDRPDGFARWSPPHRDAWEEHNNPVSIDDLFGSSFEVEAALWR